MKTLLYFLIVLGFLIGCNSSKTVASTDNESVKFAENDTISIVNEALEYEIIIIEIGFGNWLASTAKPEGYYSQEYLENRNIFMVSEWNNRVLQPNRYNPNLYEIQIDYRSGVDYGYDVNYKLYNYFIYFQLKYKQKLGVGIPRI